MTDHLIYVTHMKCYKETGYLFRYLNHLGSIIIMGNFYQFFFSILHDMLTFTFALRLFLILSLLLCPPLPSSGTHGYCLQVVVMVIDPEGLIPKPKVLIVGNRTSSSLQGEGG